MNTETNQMVIDNMVSVREKYEPFIKNKQLRVTDVDPENGLELVCYDECNDNSDDIVKNCRGIVFKGNDIVFKGFPYTYEIRSDDSNIMEHLSSIKNVRYITDAYEGALIRMFYFNNKWYTTTHRKFDAFRSKWGCQKSFGEIFIEGLHFQMAKDQLFKQSIEQSTGEDVLTRFQNTLEKNKQYMFLVKNIHENRIVCDECNKTRVFHVGTFTDGEFDDDTLLLLPRPHRHEFKSDEELINYVNYQLNVKYKQGVIIYTHDNKQYKIINHAYSDLFNVRGNEPSIKFRYLQLRHNPTHVSLLTQMYPEYTEDFMYYENILYVRAQEIYKVYVKRFINKGIATVPQEEYQIVKDCHGWHMSDRSNNKVNINTVTFFMNRQPPTVLNRIIRRVIHEEKFSDDI